MYNPLGNILGPYEGSPNVLSMFTLWIAVLGPLAAVAFAAMLIFAAELQEPAYMPTGCKKLGVPEERSFLSDEHQSKYKEGSPNKAQWKVKSVIIYPIKSCRGVELDRAQVIGTGLKYDRQFSFARLMVDSNKDAEESKKTASTTTTEKTPTATTSDEPWQFITQRQFPSLSQVRAELWVPDPTRPAYNAERRFVKSGGGLVISFPWTEPGWRGNLKALAARAFGSEARKSFIVPFDPTPEDVKTHYSEEKFTIWKETVTAINMGIHLPTELRRYLKISQPLSLMRVNTPRQVFRAAPKKKDLGWQPLVGFADAYPIHMMGLASVHEVSRRQPKGSPKLTSWRFRANIVLEGTPPFEEDKWRRLRIGKYAYHGSCRCVRCTVPNIEPNTGVRHLAQPRQTLLQTRDVDKGAPGEGCLGMNICPEKKEGIVGVGDLVEVLEEGEQFYIKQ